MPADVNLKIYTSITSFKDRLKVMHHGPECRCVFLISVFILQTYRVSHKELLLINYSDSDSASIKDKLYKTLFHFSRTPFCSWVSIQLHETDC